MLHLVWIVRRSRSTCPYDVRRTAAGASIRLQLLAEIRMSDPLNDNDRELLARAAELQRPLARAAKIAHANGSGLVVFGGLTIFVALFGPDYVALLLGAAVTGVGIVERRAGARLRQADPAAPRRLAVNELCLLGAIVVYGVLKLTLLRPDGAELERAIGDSLPGMDVKGIMDSTVTAFYGLMLAIAVGYQGGLAIYFSRKKEAVARFNSEIPEWARKVLRTL